MSAEDLAVGNFIDIIKNMSDRDRKKIRADRLIELILQLPDTGNNENYCLLEARITRIEQQYDLLKIDTLNNIGKCTETIDSINIQNIETQLRQVQKSVNNIEQYLRVNNIEIVGLPDPTENQSHEEVILEAINSLENLAYEVTRDDIDISHPIPTRRRDGKKSAVCRFLSRKTKIDVLDAKKKLVTSNIIILLFI